jgi:hypothetical protein
MVIKGLNKLLNVLKNNVCPAPVADFINIFYELKGAKLKLLLKLSPAIALSLVGMTKSTIQWE